MKKMENKNLENKLRILVIEDQAQHLDEASDYFRTVSGCEVDFCTNYNNASRAIHQREYAGVIIDIYIPAEDPRDRPQPAKVAWAVDMPVGLLIAADCHVKNIPFVFCTSGYHHGAKYQFVNSFQNIMSRKYSDWKPAMIDCNNMVEGKAIGENPNIEADHKNWKAAYETLMGMIDAKKTGE